MITSDFQTRQLLAAERRDRLALDMQLARRTRPEGASSLARRALARAQNSISSLPGLKPSRITKPQEVPR